MERKVRRNIFILLGLTVVLLVGMVLGWFFVLVRPQREQIATVQTNYDKRKSVASGLKSALADEKKELDRKNYLTGQMAFFQGRFRNFTYPELVDPASETVDQRRARIDTWRRFVREYYTDYGVALEETLVTAANDAGIPEHGFNTSFKVDPPPKAPEELTVPPNGLLKPLSSSNSGVLSVTVTGTFDQIETFLASVNRSPILFVVGNIKLEGVSPSIKATFTLTPYLVATGPGVKLPTGAAGGGASATGTPLPGAGATGLPTGAPKVAPPGTGG